jgi:amino acid permease
MLYPMIMAIYTWISGDKITLSLDPTFKHWSISYVSLILFVALVIICSKKDLAIFLRIGSFGVIFIIMLVVFIIAMGIISLGETTWILGSASDDLSFTVANW